MSFLHQKRPSHGEVRLTAAPEVCPIDTISQPQQNTADFARSVLDFHPDELQEQVLNDPSPRLLLLCTRQWGKSTVAAAKALHFALHRAGSTTLIAAASLRQSNELLAKIRAFAFTAGIALLRDTPSGVRMPNRSRILALPQNPGTIRGFSANLVIIDEAAFTSDDLFQAIRPTLAAADGTLWLLSSAGENKGFFFQTWESKHPNWSYHKATAHDCARITPAFLRHEQLLAGDADFRREYFCEFKSRRTQFMSEELIATLFCPSAGPLIEVQYGF